MGARSSSPTLFPFFARLPIDLQLMIYSYMLPGPRLVHLTFKGGDSTQLGSKTTIPAMLHLCRNARVEALKSYKLHFSNPDHDPNIYFDPRVDMLYFGPSSDPRAQKEKREDTWFWDQDSYQKVGCGRFELSFFIESTPLAERDCIQRLALNLAAIRHDSNLLRVIISFRGLRELIVLYGDSDVDKKIQCVEELGRSLRLELDEWFQQIKNVGGRCPAWRVEYRSAKSNPAEILS